MNDGPGRPRSVTDDEILESFRTATDPVLSASEVAERLSVGRRGILTRLKQLEEDGVLRSKKFGSQRTVWWYPGHTATKPDKPD
jgi:predicted ArsR family transcriptional regulator